MRRLRPLAPLVLAAVAYVSAAWLVAPGFFDGFAPPAPYRWVSPPQEVKSTNQPPTSGRTTITVQNGVTQAGHLFTIDQQASVTFPAQSFEVPPDSSPITLEIRPVASYPDLGGIVPAGNVYLLTVSTRLISPVVVVLRYGSQQSGPPGDIFASESATARWKSLSSINSAVPYTVSASTQTLGYFVVGYPPGAPAPSGQAKSSPVGAGLPLALVIIAAALAVLAGIPLILSRRRAAGGSEVESQPPAPAPPPNLGGARRRGRRRGSRR
jgi:hypothetical protein